MLAWTAGVLLLAAAVTKATDLVRNALDPDDSWPKWWWNVIPFAFGLGYTIGFQHDVIAGLFALVPALTDTHLSTTAGYIVSGLIVGGAAGPLHEVFDMLSGFASTAHRRA